MGRKLRPYWRRAGMDAAKLLDTAAREFPALQKRCVAFDDELMADLRKVGGEKFARIAALAHRQALAANKVVADANGAPLMFSKENFSNGCMGTVDVLYPAAPQLLLLSPTLAKASLHPILSYGSSERWKFPFAPHDLGTYPRADGQVYGGGERTERDQMPVEESGNMLILIAAVAKIEGNAKFAEPFWPRITAWAQYLESKGFDPENQLCTDDFAGHLAHNVNLSAKAIEALGAYALLCEMRGDKAEAARMHKVAKEMAARWVREAKDGEHYRLAFDRAGSWSQKYNLVWDEILGIKLFPAEVMKQEMAFYRTKLNRYGLPLDNRKDYTKLDWTIWTAMLTGDRADFDALVAPVFDFLNEVPQRNPMTDWYETKVAKQVGFQARSVVGGVFIPLLGDAAIWKKWAQRDLAGESRAADQMGAAADAAEDHRSRADQPESRRDVAIHFREARGRLDEAGLRRLRLAPRPRRLRHRGDAGHGRAHGMEDARHLDAPRVHAARGRDRRLAAPHLSRRRRGGFPERRPRRDLPGFRHHLHHVRDQPRRARHAQAGKEHARGALPPDRRRTVHRCRARARGGISVA